MRLRRGLTISFYLVRQVKVPTNLNGGYLQSGTISREYRGTKKLLLEPDLINQGLILTAIGIGTAFGLLVVMMLLIHIMSWVVNIPGRRANKAKRKAELEADKYRDKATAAVVAVSALTTMNQTTQPDGRAG